MTTTARIRAERLLPTAVQENWTAQRFAREVRCNKATSAKILGTTLSRVRRETQQTIVGFSGSARRTLERTAVRQVERLDALNGKPDAEWTRADLAMERQCVAILRQVIGLGEKVGRGAREEARERPQLSDGL